jgi:hypothetical protein
MQEGQATLFDHPTHLLCSSLRSPIRMFEPTPPGACKSITTNVAEMSLTIDDIYYVSLGFA